MKMSDEDKLRYLVEAGGVRLSDEAPAGFPPFRSQRMAASFFSMTKKQQRDCLALLRKKSDPHGLIAAYGPENLVRISMPDDGMEPEIGKGGSVLVAFREKVRNGDLAAVALEGPRGRSLTVRRVSWYGELPCLIPNNSGMPSELYPANRIRILGAVKL